MDPALSSNTIEVENVEQVVETFYEKGWSDGLPVVPPTEEKVLAFLGAAGLAPDEILGAIPERNRVFTAEKVAINAVMAGCLPEYFPVVAAAVRGISRPEFGLHGVCASTAGSGIMMVVNGPVASACGGRAQPGTESRGLEARKYFEHHGRPHAVLGKFQHGWGLRMRGDHLSGVP